MRRLLVAGVDGMLGRDVVAAASSLAVEVVPLTHGDLDITDADAVSAAVTETAPDAVINCAAWSNVDGAEAHEATALAVNGAGAGNLARAAAAVGARLVHVSTDYVFDGNATRPYVESDPTNPTSAYGRTKLAGEREVRAASPAHIVARTAWLFGAGRGNFVTFVLDCARSGDEIPAFTDQFGCPTYTAHLAAKLIELAAARAEGGVYHEAASSHCSRFEFAQAILAEAGLEGRIVPTSRATLAASRPGWSVIASERDGEPLPSWREGLVAFLGARTASA